MRSGLFSGGKVPLMLTHKLFIQVSLKYRGVLISGCWNRGVPLYTESGGWNEGVPPYTELSSFQVREVPLYTEVSSFQEVGIEWFHGVLISGGWNEEVPLYTEVYSFQVVGIERFHCI